MDSEIQTLNVGDFQDRFIRKPVQGMVMQTTPIQIYPLDWSTANISFPTPIFRIPYNFLLIIEQGVCRQQLDNQFYDNERGDVFLGREGQLCAINHMSADLRGYFIYVANELLPRVCPDAMQLRFFSMREQLRLSESELAWTLRCADLLYDSASQPNRDLDGECALVQALLRRIYATARRAPDFAPEDRAAEITLQFRQLVYQHYRESRDVSFYASELAVSENYLNRCVKRRTEKSAKEYINEVTIYQSQVLLQNPTREITDVAYDLNFSDPSYFARLFKRVTGQTPREYRQQWMHGSSAFPPDSSHSPGDSSGNAPDSSG